MRNMPALAKTEVRTDAAPLPKPFLSQGVVIGNMVYVSGSLGIDPSTGKMVEGTIADRTVCMRVFTITQQLVDTGRLGL
jgi:enamine deaminase RidA (YjgF/YER057c/UK114 family)